MSQEQAAAPPDGMKPDVGQAPNSLRNSLICASAFLAIFRYGLCIGHSVGDSMLPQRHRHIQELRRRIREADLRRRLGLAQRPTPGVAV